MPRLARETDPKAPRISVVFDQKMFAFYAVEPQMDTGSRAVKCRIVILDSGRNFYHRGFYVRRNLDEFTLVITIACVAIQRPNHPDCQSGPSRDPRASRGFALGN